jgi:hypothetical protein
MFCNRVLENGKEQHKETRLTDDGTRELEIDELEKSRGVSRGVYETSLVDGRVGHCKVGREGCTGLEERRGLGRDII